MGSLINKYLTKEIELDDRAVHLLFSANRWERWFVLRHWTTLAVSYCRPVGPTISLVPVSCHLALRSPAILSHLRSGTHVVVDRYAHSGVCFSSAKTTAEASGMTLDWCKAPDAGESSRDDQTVAPMTPDPLPSNARYRCGTRSSASH